jgi:hypothetical protein
MSVPEVILSLAVVYLVLPAMIVSATFGLIRIFDRNFR